MINCFLLEYRCNNVSSLSPNDILQVNINNNIIINNNAILIRFLRFGGNSFTISYRGKGDQ